MKNLKNICVLSLLIFAFNCSSDDDNGSNPDGMTTIELLTSGKWYLESKTPGSFTDCEKNSSFKFNTNDTVDVESFDDSSGPCESDGVISSTYSLSGTTLSIDLGGTIVTATINSVSETTLDITDQIGDNIIFDKTQG